MEAIIETFARCKAEQRVRVLILVIGVQECSWLMGASLQGGFGDLCHDGVPHPRRDGGHHAGHGGRWRR